jgi:hypothetical protein
MNKTVNPRDILLRPVISEKSLRLADDGKYTFIVAPGTHKTQIRQAVDRGEHDQPAGQAPPDAIRLG